MASLPANAETRLVRALLPSGQLNVADGTSALPKLVADGTSALPKLVADGTSALPKLGTNADRGGDATGVASLHQWEDRRGAQRHRGLKWGHSLPPFLIFKESDHSSSLNIFSVIFQNLPWR